MKKTVIIIATAMLFAACNKETTLQPNTPAPNPAPASAQVAAAHWIPNWQNDTIVGEGNNPSSVDEWDNLDIMYTIKRGDTSLIRYHGTEYYVWIQCPYTEPDDYPDWFKKDQKSYSWVFIGETPFDVSSAVTGSSLCSVTPPKYYDKSYNKWHEQEFTLMLNPQKPPFAEWVYMGFYTSYYKQFLK